MGIVMAMVVSSTSQNEVRAFARSEWNDVIC